MDTVDNALCSTMSIDLNYHKSIVTDNIYGWIPSTIHCNGQHVSIYLPVSDKRTMTIDG